MSINLAGATREGCCFSTLRSKIPVSSSSLRKLEAVERVAETSFHQASTTTRRTAENPPPLSTSRRSSLLLLISSSSSVPTIIQREDPRSSELSVAFESRRVALIFSLSLSTRTSPEQFKVALSTFIALLRSIRQTQPIFVISSIGWPQSEGVENLHWFSGVYEEVVKER